MNVPQGGRSEQEVSLREYLDDRMRRLEQYVDTEFSRRDVRRIEDRVQMDVRLAEHQASHDREHAAAKDNAEKDEKKLDIRLEGMNEVRKTLSDLSATMATRQYVDARFDAVLGKIDQAEKNAESRREAETKAITARQDAVDKTLAQQAGRTGGTAQTIAFLALAITVLGNILAIYFALSGGQ